MSILPPIRFSLVSRKHVGPCGLSAPPLELCLDFRRSSRGNSPDNTECPATSESQGSFNWDREKGEFTLEWENLAEFERWRWDEEDIYSIELIASTTRAGGTHWSQRKLFVCGREPSGGGTYTKKHPERELKIGTRKSGCRCQVVIKSYPHTPTILGRYLAEHDHEIGSANIVYTHLSGIAWEQIKTMLTQKIDRKEIVSCRCRDPKMFSC